MSSKDGGARRRRGKEPPSANKKVIQKILEAEGKTARNLVSYLVSVHSVDGGIIENDDEQSSISDIAVEKPTWADKVKGINKEHYSPCDSNGKVINIPSLSEHIEGINEISSDKSLQSESDDGGEWEVVTKKSSKRRQFHSSLSAPKQCRGTPTISRYASTDGYSTDMTQKKFTVTPTAHTEKEEDIIATLQMTPGWVADDQKSLQMFSPRRPHTSNGTNSQQLSPVLGEKSAVGNSIEKLEFKQAKAAAQREKLISEKTERLRQQTKKVDDVRCWRDDMEQQRRQTLEQRLAAAEHRRLQQLERVKARAKDEEIKGNEIAFINSLELSNKRQDLLAKEAEQKARREALDCEQRRRFEQQAAKEQAAEERRQALDDQRRLRLEALLEKRRQRDERVEALNLERENQRVKTAELRATELQDRLRALRGTYEEQCASLQTRIEQKQLTTAKRHDEYLRLVRSRAVSLALGIKDTAAASDTVAPAAARFDCAAKLCEACSVVLCSEPVLLSHIRTPLHKSNVKIMLSKSENSSNPSELGNVLLRPLTYLKDVGTIGNEDGADNNATAIVSEQMANNVTKKRCQKLRHKWSVSNEDKTNLSVSDAHVIKAIKELQKLSNSSDSFDQKQLVVVDRHIAVLHRFVLTCVQQRGGATLDVAFVDAIENIYIGLLGKCGSDQSSRKSTMVLAAAMKLVSMLWCHFFKDANRRYGSAVSRYPTAVFDTVDFLCRALRTTAESVLMNEEKSFEDISAAAWVLSAAFGTARCVQDSTEESSDTQTNVAQDINIGAVAYVVHSGCIDHLSQLVTIATYLTKLDASFRLCLGHLLNLLSAVVMATCWRLSPQSNGNTSPKKKSKRKRTKSDDGVDSGERRLKVVDEETGLITTIVATDIAGVLYLVYAVVLDETNFEDAASQRCDSAALSPATSRLLLAAFQLVSWVAALRPAYIQSALAARGWAQFTRLASFVLSLATAGQQRGINEEGEGGVGATAASSDDGEGVLLESLVATIISALGFFCLQNAQSQLLVGDSLLTQLTQLPILWFTDERRRSCLLASLLAVCFHCDDNTRVLRREMSLKLLTTFLDEKLQRRSSDCGGDGVGDELADTAGLPPLDVRFPRALWPAAAEYFAVMGA